jgi:hypothetical protein
MAPEHLKPGTIGLALVSIVLAARAAIEWGRPGAEPSVESPEHSSRFGRR